MILRAEQGPLTSPSTGVLPGGRGGSWLEPAPGTSVRAEGLCYSSWVWSSALGERGQGQAVLHISSYCFFTHEVGEWMAWDNLSL